MSAIPLQPNKYTTDINDLYVAPWLIEDTIENETDRNIKYVAPHVIENENGAETETENESEENYESESDEDERLHLCNFFYKGRNIVKSVYVLGDAGSGKTTFCRNLTNQWCLANTEPYTVSNEYEILRSFDFLFYVSLRSNSENVEIKDMLHKLYPHAVLDKLLEKDSSRCLIIMDGLDEWDPDFKKKPQFQTKGLPVRDVLKDYTVLITSRPWKVQSLGVTANEMQQKIMLHGIDKSSSTRLIEKTTNILNETFGGVKSSEEFEAKLEEIPLSEIERTPMMLKQMICLWYEGKLHGTTRCAIYSSMLELYFDWAQQRHDEDQILSEVIQLPSHSDNCELPQYLYGLESCEKYRYVIDHVSRLAYETLFRGKKESSLAFNEKELNRLQIPGNVTNCCLKVGILTEETDVGFCISKPSTSSFAFVHKSIQEFLAAVHIAIQFKRVSGEPKTADTTHSKYLGKNHIAKYFESCKNVKDIFEQVYVFIMVCGLDPLLATHVSKFIYDIVDNEADVHKYRSNIINLSSSIFIEDYAQIIGDIQNCIVWCMKEAMSQNKEIEIKIYLADLIYDGLDFDPCEVLTRNEKCFAFDNVLSLNWSPFSDSENERRFLENRFSRLKAVRIRLSRCKNIVLNAVQKCLRHSESSLTTLSVKYLNERHVTFNSIQDDLYNMRKLQAIDISNSSLTHEMCTKLCEFLTKATYLQEIAVNVECDQEDQHTLDLSKHEHLQWLIQGRHTGVVVTAMNTNNLERCHLRLDPHNYASVLVGLHHGGRLQRLDLGYPDLKYDELEPPECPELENSHPTINLSVTDELMTLLPTLSQLTELYLTEFTFDKNIISQPADMKNLVFIGLECEYICELAWTGFLDSLPSLPKTVYVQLSEVGQLAVYAENKAVAFSNLEEAAQFVRERKDAFAVKLDNDYQIYFCTKKAL